MLSDAKTSVLEVAFERVPVNPDYVNVIVSVTTGAGGSRSGIVVGEGGMVSPTQLMVEFGSAESYEFYVMPDEGYVIESIEAPPERRGEHHQGWPSICRSCALGWSIRRSSACALGP